MSKTPIKKMFLRRYKFWHYLLIFSILILLIILAILLYNELVNEKKLIRYFNELNVTESRLENLDQTKNDIIQSQDFLIKYLLNNNKESIDDYISSIKKTKGLIESLQMPSANPELNSTLTNFNDKESESFEKFDHYIDSISENVLPALIKNSTIKAGTKIINYDDLDIKTTIETNTVVDSVEKKKLFGRLGDAIRGDVEVQKEKVEHTVVIEYGSNKTSGTLDEQMQEFFKKISEYYETRLRSVNNNFSKTINNNNNLLLINSEIQNQSQKLISEYKNALLEQREILDSKFNIQYGINRTLRFYTLLGIASVLIFLTIIVSYLTKTIYDYENKLVEAGEELNHNLMIKDKLVSMISHDIRAPLSIISLYIKQLLNIEKDTQKKDIFQSIDYTTSSAVLLANRVLDFSKNENKISDIKNTTFNLYEEINQIVNAFTPLSQAKNNELINNNHIPENTTIEFDRQKLQRIYFNLLDNAIKYTKNGQISVTSNLNKKDGKNRFELIVKDTGKGIKIDQLNKLFDPYESDSISDMKSSEVAVGLGLYLCKEIVDMFNGNIEVKSNPDKGTEVSLYIFLD